MPDFPPIDEQWLNQRVGTNFHPNELSDVLEGCVQRVVEDIKTYRPNENPNDYLDYIRDRVDRLAVMLIYGEPPAQQVHLKHKGE